MLGLVGWEGLWGQVGFFEGQDFLQEGWDFLKQSLFLFRIIGNCSVMLFQLKFRSGGFVRKWEGFFSKVIRNFCYSDWNFQEGGFCWGKVGFFVVEGGVFQGKSSFFGRGLRFFRGAVVFRGRGWLRRRIVRNGRGLFFTFFRVQLGIVWDVGVLDVYLYFVLGKEGTGVSLYGKLEVGGIFLERVASEEQSGGSFFVVVVVFVKEVWGQGERGGKIV